MSYAGRETQTTLSWWPLPRTSCKSLRRAKLEIFNKCLKFCFSNLMLQGYVKETPNKSMAPLLLFNLIRKFYLIWGILKGWKSPWCKSVELQLTHWLKPAASLRWDFLQNSSVQIKSGVLLALSCVPEEFFQVSATSVPKIWGWSSCHLSGSRELSVSLASLYAIALQWTPDCEPDISVLCLERRCVLGK